MALPSGTRVGSYEVVGQIGAGGMGEVYRAHDTKLGRDVAIKVIPANFVNDPERLSRFQREARMLAALNHANIATIYGLEQSGGVTCLVMELVSGQTLADRVKAGGLPIEEALNIAVQIAEALEAAHEKSIIHRGLMAVPFDPQRLAVSGTAAPVVEGVLQSPINRDAQYSISATR